MTQKEPNKGKVTPQLDVRSSLREAPPKAQGVRATRARGPPRSPQPRPLPPPQIQAAVTAPPIAGVVPDAAPAAEKPKIVLENVGPAATPVTPPDNPSIKLPRPPLT